MKITYQITADEYADAQRAHLSSKASWRWRNRITLAGAILMLALSIFIAIIDRTGRAMVRPGIIFFSLCLAFLLLRHTNLLWRWQYNKIDSLKRENTVEIREDGITASTEAARSEIKWISYIRWYESKTLFLLYQQPRLFNIYPKRAFGPGEVDEFRELLQRKIPAKP